MVAGGAPCSQSTLSSPVHHLTLLLLVVVEEEELTQCDNISAVLVVSDIIPRTEVSPSPSPAICVVVM